MVGVVLAAVVGGCGYAPANIAVSEAGRRICAPRTPQTASELQAVFDTRGPWWSGADGGFVVDLPDGRRLWMFGDTIVGQAHALDRRYLDRNAMVNNSLVVQSGRCFEVRMQGSPLGATRSALEHPDRGRMWWPQSGVHDPVSNKVLVFALRQDTGNWYVNHGMDLIELSWPGLEYVGHRALPFATSGDFPALGTTAMIDGDWLYVYGAPVRGLFKPGYVGRTAWPPTGELAFEYFDGTGWTVDPGQIRPMAAGSVGALGVYQVYRTTSGYVAVNKPFDGIDGSILQWRSDSAVGPWQPAGAVSGPVRYNAAGWTYGVRAWPMPDGSWVLMRSENPMSMDDLYADLLRYGIRFTRWSPPR